MLFQRVFSVIRNFRITASTYGGYFNTTKIFSLGMAIFCQWAFLQIYGQTENTNPKRNILQYRPGLITMKQFSFLVELSVSRLPSTFHFDRFKAQIKKLFCQSWGQHQEHVLLSFSQFLGKTSRKRLMASLINPNKNGSEVQIVSHP